MVLTNTNKIFFVLVYGINQYKRYRGKSLSKWMTEVWSCSGWVYDMRLSYNEKTLFIINIKIIFKNYNVNNNIPIELTSPLMFGFDYIAFLQNFSIFKIII